MAKRGEKTRCNGRWTEARFNTFVKNLLRDGHLKWACANDAKILARDGKLINPKTNRPNIASRCAVCDNRFLESVMKVDHIDPVIDPSIGFTNWSDYVYRLLVEVDKYQILCKSCHDVKTLSENKLRYKK